MGSPAPLLATLWSSGCTLTSELTKSGAGFEEWECTLEGSIYLSGVVTGWAALRIALQQNS
jgi:hypothetical protein